MGDRRLWIWGLCVSTSVTLDIPIDMLHLVSDIILRRYDQNGIKTACARSPNPSPRLNAGSLGFFLASHRIPGGVLVGA